MSSVLRMSGKGLIGHFLDSIECALTPPKRMSIGKFHKVCQWIFLKWLQQTSLHFAGFQGTDSRRGNLPAKLSVLDFKLRHYRLVSSPDRWPWSSFRFYHLNDASVLTMDRLA